MACSVRAGRPGTDDGQPRGVVVVEEGFGGPVATQRPLTQGNKLRELMDQLHKVIWQII